MPLQVETPDFSFKFVSLVRQGRIWTGYKVFEYTNARRPNRTSGFQNTGPPGEHIFKKHKQGPEGVIGTNFDEITEPPFLEFPK